MIEATPLAEADPRSAECHQPTDRVHLEVTCERGAAIWDQERPAEIQLMVREEDGAHEHRNGFRTVILGPGHPYVAEGFPMAAPGIGFGQNDGFVFQARAFLEEVTGLAESDSWPRNATFDDGVHNMKLIAAIAESAADHGREVTIDG